MLRSKASSSAPLPTGVMPNDCLWPLQESSRGLQLEAQMRYITGMRAIGRRSPAFTAPALGSRRRSLRDSGQNP
eukprot:3062847-Amphidinium_carterae.1